MNSVLQKTITIILFSLVSFYSSAQNKLWSLTDCIQYAVANNISVLKSQLSVNSWEQNTRQARDNRLPSVQASVSHNVNMSREFNAGDITYGSLVTASNTSCGVSTEAVLFNGFKMNYQIKQKELELQSSRFYAQSVIESVEVNILNAYLQVLYAKEEVINATRQIESTTEQLALALERKNLGLISNADYLQIKSELASEKLTLANTESTLTIVKVNLMQLMEMPVNDAFDIQVPNLDSLLAKEESADVQSIYQSALHIMPQIKQTELTLASTSLEEKIAKADLYPSLSVGAGISTGWSDQVSGYHYLEQLNNQINPYIGFNLSIPVFQKNKIKTSVRLARISVQNSRYDAIETKNNLRKEVEQASVDVLTSQTRYKASREQYEAALESFEVATEKFNIGLVSSVDFLVEKTRQITAETDLLQARFSLLFSYKILDYYKGIPIRLSK